MSCAVILTALPVEYLAVRTPLSDLREEMHPQGTIYERGTFTANGHTWEVGIAEVGAGNAGAAVEAERAIAYFKPDILLFVGIAGGIKDVAIGDVVAATDVYSYESGKAGDGQEFAVRPKAGKSSYAIIQRAKAEARKGDWLQRISPTVTRKPKVHIAPIAAGEKVIASRESDLFQFIRENYNDAIAVEMEGFGFLSAAFAYPEIKAIVIRGISDLIKDKNKADPEAGTEEERQERASLHATAFSLEVLSRLCVNNELNPSKNAAGQDPKNSNHADLLKDVEQKHSQLAQLDQHIDPYLDPKLKEVLNWLTSRQSSLAERIVDKALESCPSLRQIVRKNERLEDRIYWEFEKYLESIHNALMTKHQDLLDQPAISPFLSREGILFSPEEMSLFKSEVGVFYSLACQELGTAFPKRYSEEIKLEFMEYIGNLRNNLPT